MMKKLLSLLSLVAVFAACQPETIETAFEVKNAEVTINVSAVDVQSGRTVAATFSTNAEASVAGNVITIVGKPSIPAQVITITAAYLGDNYSVQVPINELLAAGKATYTVIVPVGKIISDGEWKVELDIKTSETKTDKGWLADAKIEKTIDGETYLFAENLSDDCIEVTVSYDITSTSAADNFTLLDENFKLQAETFLEAYSFSNASNKSFSTTFSSMCYYTIFTTRTTTITTYLVKAVKGTESKDVATFDVEKTESQIDCREIEHDKAHGHYMPGHGHGTEQRDGGGIVYSE